MYSRKISSLLSLFLVIIPLQELSAEPQQFPYVVSLHAADKFDSQLCLGAILTDQWIVTAAHCLWFTKDVEKLYITSNDLAKYKLAKIVEHPDFNDFHMWNDIVLIKIDGKFEFSDSLAPIAVSETLGNENCIVVGWKRFGVSTESKSVDARTLTPERCDANAFGSRYNRLARGPGQFCANSWGTQTCFGEIAGPLVFQNTLLGIGSYGLDKNCENNKFPVVYTKLSHYMKWIENIVEEE